MDDQQRARELQPCPFCGYAMAEEEDGAYQNDGFAAPQTPVWLVTCPGSDCNASVSGTSKESAMAAWNRRAALRAAPEGFVMVPVEMLQALTDEAHAGINQTVFHDGKREKHMAVVREARALLAARPQGVKDV